MEVFSPQVSGMGHSEKGTRVGHGLGQDAGGMGHGTQDRITGGTEDVMGCWRVGHEMMQEGWDRGMGHRKDGMQEGKVAGRMEHGMARRSNGMHKGQDREWDAVEMGCRQNGTPQDKDVGRAVMGTWDLGNGGGLMGAWPAWPCATPALSLPAAGALSRPAHGAAPLGSPAAPALLPS